MNWISTWIQGIIVAVIISTIIEMILPEGNSKKYVKVVIGVYILFSIVSPVITKITGSNLKLSNIFQIEEYLQTSAGDTTYDNLDKKQEEQIKSIYQTNLKRDITQKLEAKGYDLQDIYVQIDSTNQYKIQKLTLNVTKKIEGEAKEEKENNSILVVNEIKIQVGKQEQNTVNQTQETKQPLPAISQSQKQMLKQYLSSTYEIEEQNININ